MALEHEYTVIGHSRSAWGRRMGALAGGLAALGALFAAAALRLAERLGRDDEVPDVVLWPVTAALVYGGVHWLFNQYVWRWRWFTRFLGVPDISGRWNVCGRTLNPADGVPADWVGELIVSQTWEKIQVYLKTAHSASQSKAASLIHERGVGYRLLYSYQNVPRAGEPLQPHVGYAEVLFSEGLLAGEGEYFNNKGRVTFGRLTVEREA
jgi:hypothetical protein